MSAIKGAAALAAVLLAVLLTVAGTGGASPTKTVRVGLVTDIGQLNDRGFNALAYQGAKEAEKKLGIELRVAESKSAGDYIPNLSSFARKGYDLVIGVGFTEIAAMEAVAARFPKTRFAIVDVSYKDLKGKPRNVRGLLFREEQVGYLAGYLGALQEKRRRGPDVVSTVGGQQQPPVDRFIAGFQAGARKASPGVRTLNGYSQDFVDQAKCKELALTQISQGSGVVFQVAGGCGLGALDAARQRKVWGVGVDADQSFLGPHILTSAMKAVDRAVFLTIQDVAKGRFRGGADSVYSLKQGGVRLGKISSKVPRADVVALNRIKAQILAGKIRIPTEVK